MRQPAPRPRTVADTSPLPEPPSMEPKEYAAWLKQQPRADQRRIAAFCANNRRNVTTTCGGIGPLHIPYAPMVRIWVKRPGDGHPESLFSSMEAWEAQLTPAQKRYMDTECQGGEDRPSSDLCGDNTPLVVAFGGEPVTFAQGGAFAFQAGAPTATDWPTATTPWIALDRDGNGTIDGGAELFGSDTVLGSGARAVNGFATLAELDANGDGVIDAADPAFARLLVWADRDGDRRSSPGELSPLSSVATSISLAHRRVPRCDERLNCEGERSALKLTTGATGAVIDVYLHYRDYLTAPVR
jgi:hypothetical protein